MVNCPPDAVDLIEKCLTFTPGRRISAVQALNHPYVAEFHNKENETECHRKMKLPIDDNKKKDKGVYKDAVLDMVKKKNNDIKALRRLDMNK